MANSVAEAEQMVQACRTAQRLPMIAYRCEYEVDNVELRRRARAGELGSIQLIDSVNTQNQGDPSKWRQKKASAGGGSLPDVGLYCLNTTRALLGEEPYEVSAVIHSPPNDPRFREVEATVSFVLRLPSGAVANCASSYSLHEHRNFRILGDRSVREIESAFGYEGQRLRLSRREGQAEANLQLELARKTSSRSRSTTWPNASARDAAAHTGRGGPPGPADHGRHLSGGEGRASSQAAPP